jgi:hypothetical protein
MKAGLHKKSALDESKPAQKKLLSGYNSALFLSRWPRFCQAASLMWEEFSCRFTGTSARPVVTNLN